MTVADTTMNIFGLLAIWIGLIVAFGVAAYFILKRAGLNPAFAAFVLLPFAGPLILMGILAFRTWPNEPEGYR